MIENKEIIGSIRYSESVSDATKKQLNEFFEKNLPAVGEIIKENILHIFGVEMECTYTEEMKKHPVGTKVCMYKNKEGILCLSTVGDRLDTLADIIRELTKLRDKAMEEFRWLMAGGK